MGTRHSRQITSQNTVVQEKSRDSLKQQQVSKSHSLNSVIISGRQYHAEHSTYALPRDELEQDRLNSQHFSLKALYNGNILKSVEKTLPPKARVLDLGCGSGSWVMEMAIDYPEYEIIGADMSDMFPTTIRPENVRFELYNILNGLPYPDNSFDFVHMRLMIIAFRANEWPIILKEIYRVLKPGGLVQLMESDFTEKANVQIVETFNTEFRNAMLEIDQDPWIGTKLHDMLTQQQFNVIEQNEKYLDYSLPLDAIAKEMLINWKNAMLSIRPLLAHRFPDSYDRIIDQYIQGVTQAGWKVKMWAFCGQKLTIT